MKKNFLIKVLLVFMLITTFNVNTFSVGADEGMNLKDRVGNQDYNILTTGEVIFKDSDGNIVTEITKDSKVSITFNFEIEKSVLEIIEEFDYFEFDLPDILKVSIPIAGVLEDESSGKEYADFTIGTDNKVRFTFKNVKHLDITEVSGELNLNVSLDEDFIDNSGENKIELPVNDKKEYEFVIKPTDKIAGVDKKGKVDRDLNPEYINWEVLINRDFRDLKNVRITEQLPVGVTLEGIEVLPYIVDLDGKFVGYGTAIDPSTKFYSLDGDNVLFPNIKTPFAIRYKTRIDDSFKPDEGGPKIFVNNVTLTADDVDQISTDATVSGKYGVLINKKDPVYSGNDPLLPGRQTFTWNIEYNYGDKTIKNPVLLDTFDADLEYIANSLVLKYKDGTIVPSGTYQVIPGSNTLEIRFNTTVDKAIDISYKTAVKEGVLITEDREFKNKVVTGGKESDSTGTAETQLIKKTSPAIDYNNKLISWSIDINTNRYDLKNYKLTDEYINASTNKGLTFNDGSLVVWDVDTNSAIDSSNYVFTKTYDANNVETGYTLDFIGDYATTNHMIRVSFKTHYDTRYLAPKTATKPAEIFKNKATLTWTDKNNVDRSHSSTATRDVNGPARNNGQKKGTYDHGTKEITWTSDINYNGIDLKNARIEDIIEATQSYVLGSLEIRPYTVAANGSIVRGEKLEDLSKFNITHPTATNGHKLMITLPEGNGRYSISYRTSVEGDLILETYRNRLDFFNDNDITRSYDATVTPPKGGKILAKSGKQDGAIVNWTVEINGSQSTIEEAILKDTPSNNQFYLEDTFNIYPVVYKGNTYDVIRDTPLVEGVDYELIFKKDDVGNLSFEVHFLDTLKRMFVLEYATQISASPGDTTLKNAVELSGKNYQYEDLGDTGSVPINVDSAGGGAVGIRGNLTLRKLGESDIPLEGVVFELYKDGRKISTETTDKDGKLRFHRLVHGDYIIKEIETLDGYVIPEDLFEGKIFTVNAETSTETHTFVIHNKTSKLTINKLGVGQELLAGSRFELSILNDDKYDVVMASLDVVNGSVTLEGLKAGKYRLKELGNAADYILNTQPLDFEIVVDKNGQVIDKTVDFTNYKGSVKLVKKDESSKLLPGVTYDLYKNGLLESEHSPLVTDANGEINLVNALQPGNYYFKETASAEGNIINPELLHFVIASEAIGEPETMLVSATNYKGSVSFKKVDNTGAALPGVTFELWSTDADELIGTVVSDADGLVTVNQVAAGNYEFREIIAADGFVINKKPIVFTIDAETANGKHDLVLADFVNYKGAVKLSKSDEGTNLLAGVKFDLYTADGERIKEDLVTKFGVLEVTDLAPGSYYFKETSTVDGNVLYTGNIPFVVPEEADGVVNIEVEVLNTKASVTFKKVDANGEPVSGIIFILNNKDTGKEVARVISDEEGVVFVDGLAPGNYEFIEWLADGYIINTEELSFNIPEESDLVKVELELEDFVNYKGSVILTKTDEFGVLEGVVFNLYTEDGNLVYENLETDDMGQIELLDVLVPGSYYFEEIASANGNLINKTPIRFVIASSWSGVPEVIEVSATNAKASVSFKKVDANGKPLANTLFELIDLETDEVIATVVSDENGLVYVDQLIAGRYAFREVKENDGFILNTKLLEFEVPESSFDDKLELVLEDFVNYKGGVVVKKIDPNGKLLNGAKFVLKDATGKVVADLTVKKGIGVIQDLAPGTYTLSEVSAPKGYDLTTKVFDVVIPESFEGDYINLEIEVVNTLSETELPNAGLNSYMLYSAFGAVVLGFVLILVSRRKVK